MRRLPANVPRPHLAVLSWCFYDWTNSAFVTVITIFVFWSYFIQAVAKTPVIGTAKGAHTLTILVFFVVGMQLLKQVREPSI